MTGPEPEDPWLTSQPTLQFHVEVQVKGSFSQMDEYLNHLTEMATLSEHRFHQEEVPLHIRPVTATITWRLYTHFEAPRAIDAMIMGFGFFGPKPGNLDDPRIIEITISEQTAPMSPE